MSYKDTLFNEHELSKRSAKEKGLVFLLAELDAHKESNEKLKEDLALEFEKFEQDSMFWGCKRRSDILKAAVAFQVLGQRGCDVFEALVGEKQAKILRGEVEVDGEEYCYKPALLDDVQSFFEIMNKHFFSHFK